MGAGASSNSEADEKAMSPPLLSKNGSFGKDFFSGSRKHLTIAQEKDSLRCLEKMSKNLFDLNSTRCAAGEVKSYRLRLDGSNDVYIGAASRDCDLHLSMTKNTGIWCCWLYDRSIFKAGKWIEDGRTKGPDSFLMPSEIIATIDTTNGTLAMKVVGGEDLGVVISSLPVNRPLHLSVGSGSEKCKITLKEAASMEGAVHFHV